ncbi:MAG: hypothetical protein FJ303_01820 [Planctomycetes bacterium]|nr:hypothetical protein [Planctomycetota bacterium]
MQRHGCRLALVLAATLAFVFAQGCDSSKLPKLAVTSQTEFLFCHWNVENFFDDKADGRTGPGDREYDALYPDRPDLLQLKLAKLTEAILKMNGGKGPDILALVEVESVRAAELLRQALNAKLSDKKLHYENLLMQEVSVGRHIAPAILTRLPVVKDRTRLIDRVRRILVGHIKLNDHELVVIASHWTSRLQESGVKGRADYADKIYGAVNAIYRTNPAADVLISGDFNDDPSDVSVVEHLNAIGDANAVRNSNPLKLLNTFAGKDANESGTHYYKQWHIFDQIVVSPGLLDSKGWSCDPKSAAVFNELYRPKDKNRRPWRFGGANEKNERGYSDHFPVTIRLRLEAK